MEQIEGKRMTDLQPIITHTEAMLKSLGRTDARQTVKNALKRMAGRHVPAHDPIFWPAGMLLLGVLEAGESLPYLDAWMNAGCRVMHVDDALTGYVLVRLYAQTRDEKYLNAAGRICAFLLSAKKDEERSIIYHPEIGEKNRLIYADGAGMTSLFLAAYARETQDTDAFALALTQVMNFLHHGLDDRTGLPYHAYYLATKEKLGIVGWGRAVGWLLMGMSEIIQMLPTGFLPPETYQSYDLYLSQEELQQSWTRLTENVMSYLRPDGSFSWQLPALDGHGDTSTTAMIGWALAGEPAKGTGTMAGSIRDYLTSCTRDGIVGSALGECVDYGQYPQTFGNYPWGQGAALAFLAREANP